MVKPRQQPSLRCSNNHGILSARDEHTTFSNPISSRRHVTSRVTSSNRQATPTARACAHEWMSCVCIQKDQGKKPRNAQSIRVLLLFSQHGVPPVPKKGLLLTQRQSGPPGQCQLVPFHGEPHHPTILFFWCRAKFDKSLTNMICITFT